MATLVKAKRRHSRMSMDVVAMALKEQPSAAPTGLLSVDHAHQAGGGSSGVDANQAALLAAGVERRRNLSLDLAMMKEKNNARRVSNVSVAASSDADSRGGRMSRRRSSSKSLKQQDSEHLDFVLGKVGRLDHMAGSVVDEKKRTDQYVEDDGRRHAVAEKTIKYVDPVTGVRTSRRLYAHSSRIEISQGALTKPPPAEPTSVLEMLRDPSPVTEVQGAPRPPTSPRPPANTPKPPRKTPKASKERTPKTQSPRTAPAPTTEKSKVDKQTTKVDKQTETDVMTKTPVKVSVGVQSEKDKVRSVSTKATNTDALVEKEVKAAPAVETTKETATTATTTNVYCCHHHCCCCCCSGRGEVGGRSTNASSSGMMEMISLIMSQNAMLGPLMIACMNEERAAANSGAGATHGHHGHHGHHHHCCAQQQHGRTNVRTVNSTAAGGNDMFMHCHHHRHFVDGAAAACSATTCPFAVAAHCSAAHGIAAAATGVGGDALGGRFGVGGHDSTNVLPTDFELSGGKYINSLWQSATKGGFNNNPTITTGGTTTSTTTAAAGDAHSVHTQAAHQTLSLQKKQREDSLQVSSSGSRSPLRQLRHDPNAAADLDIVSVSHLLSSTLAQIPQLMQPLTTGTVAAPGAVGTGGTAQPTAATNTSGSVPNFTAASSSMTLASVASVMIGVQSQLLSFLLNRNMLTLTQSQQQQQQSFDVNSLTAVNKQGLLLLDEKALQRDVSASSAAHKAALDAKLPPPSPHLTVSSTIARDFDALDASLIRDRAASNKSPRRKQKREPLPAGAVGNK